MKRLQEMTLEEKIGQLLMVGFPGTEITSEMTRLIIKNNLGGIIYFSRNVKSNDQLAKTSTEFQNLAKESSSGFPLFISIDQEGGLVSRLSKDATVFPGNMALGAINDPKAVYEMAKVVACELKAFGVNFNLAPVLDVNNNPENPVIGIRSYGEDPELVSQLGIAYINGLQEEGVIACGKHFPGHGDTAFDSHLALAIVPHDKERLERVELKPFQNAIKSGLAAIMSAHVIFPAFEPEPGIPGTLSKRVLTDLLRDKMGYDGLIITDCMEMKAIADNFGPEEAAIRAIEAGADQVLISHTFDVQIASYEGILQAVESGRLTEERIDQSITRILKLKEKIANEEWGSQEQLAMVGSEEHRKLARKIGQRVVTLVKDEQGLIPAIPAENKDVIVICPEAGALTIVEERDGGPKEVLIRAFKEKYQNVEAITITMNPDDKEMEEVKRRVQNKDLIIFSAFYASKNPEQAKLINELARTNSNLVVLAIRNPYDLQVLSEAKVYLTTYDFNEYSLEGAVQVIAGEISASGELPITIPGGVL
ncbi:MAG: beta-N-acetylhexosaminidase [Halanaerobiales bacterium]|nr:beta-N-acetylhexosaminidase [Halanaerobiales bacterium]